MTLVEWGPLIENNCILGALTVIHRQAGNVVWPLKYAGEKVDSFYGAFFVFRGRSECADAEVGSCDGKKRKLRILQDKRLQDMILQVLHHSFTTPFWSSLTKKGYLRRRGYRLWGGGEGPTSRNPNLTLGSNNPNLFIRHFCIKRAQIH